MTVLSRKPASQTPKTADSHGQLSIEDEEEEDEASKNAMTPEERMQKAQREREEKQRAYEERRRELFGKESTPSTPASGKKGGSPRSQSRANRAESRPSSSAGNKSRQLYEPNEISKPDMQRPTKKDYPPNEFQPIREPRAPDGSGRGGSGFAPRGGRST